MKGFRQMNRRQMLAATGTGAVMLAGGWWITRPTGLGETALLPGAAMAQESGAAVDTSTIEEMVLGDPNAPVELIEYASFTCPHCAAFHADQYQRLKAEYIETGLVRFVMREVYFDRFGLWASMVARCGGQERFFPIAETLYAQQRDWIGDGQNPQAIVDRLRRIGISSGIDQADLDACLSDAQMAETLVAWFQENAARDEVNATPTLFLDGEKYSNMGYEALKELIDARLASQ